jgi:hypothetical protein
MEISHAYHPHAVPRAGLAAVLQAQGDPMGMDVGHQKKDWTVISMKNDWKRVFAFE